MAPSLGESPLKQVNKAGQPKRSKLQASWDDLATNPQLFATDNSPLPTRYCSEFYCLRPNRTVQNAALAGISDGDLLGKYRTNVSELFIGGIKILKDAPPADVTRSNAVETLIPFLRHVFARNFSNKEQDVMTVLGGDAERHDQVFSDMVSALDATLRNVKVPVSVRHRVLQLALTLVACANQSPLTSYFLRRDLFSTLVAFIADDSTKQFAFESALLLGLLANYRKSEARNPYVVRIQDFVEEGIMERIIDVVSTVCSRARDSYVSISDDTPPSLVASLSSFVKSLRITEFLTGGFYLPPPPLPAPLNGQGGTQNGAAGSEDVKGKGKEEEVVEEKPDNEDAPKDETVPVNGSGDVSASASSSASPTSPRKPPPPTISLPASPTSPTRPTSRRPPLSPRSSSTSLKLRPEDAPFATMPPEMVVVLLAFYELLNSNKTFCSLVFGEREEGAPPSLPTELISLTSYIVSHASVTTHRARLYSRLCLIILLILVEEGEAKLSVARAEGEEIRVCRQRQPMLPPRDPARTIPLSAMIDTVVIFLRHGLKKRLDVDTYTIALRLLQRIFQQLKTEKLRIARDWVVVWRAMLSLASFIVTHSVELRQNSGRLDALISQLFITLSYAAYWGEQILPNSAAQARIHYELLHADETLDALSDLLGISSVATPSVTPPGSSNGSILPPLNRRDTPTRSTFFTLSQFSPTKSSFRSSSSLGVGTGGSGTGDGFVATECIANLRSSITFFSNHINALRLTKGTEDELEPDEILGVIERNLGGVELIESAAMGDLGRFAGEDIAAGFFEELVGVACEDTLRLLDAEQIAVPSSP
ncbi:RHTO0S08e00826g1_1 [Rhodotorula toruloides]|uniref:RHTO0S08e00826g1_1 n=1 Tax=Rhodotorula toruloides TaxID=5286 RepID=A0A061B6G6_RHOTO|nr:RHTO0S08e00826g1_1 [Rhodotorula toruloides]